MLQNAMRLCEAKFGTLWLAEDKGFRPVTAVLAVSRQPEQIRHFIPETPQGRVIATKRLVHVADTTAVPRTG